MQRLSAPMCGCRSLHSFGILISHLWGAIFLIEIFKVDRASKFYELSVNLFLIFVHVLHFLSAVEFLSHAISESFCWSCWGSKKCHLSRSRSIIFWHHFLDFFIVESLEAVLFLLFNTLLQFFRNPRRLYELVYQRHRCRFMIKGLFGKLLSLSQLLFA